MDKLIALQKQPKLHLVHYNSFLNPSWGINFNFWNLPLTALHDHNYFEIFLVTKGPLLYFCNGQEYLLKKQTLVFVRPQDVHQFKNPPKAVQQQANLAVLKPILYEFCNLLSPTFFDKLSNFSKPIMIELSTENYKFLSTQIRQLPLEKISSEIHLPILKTLLFTELSLIFKWLLSYNDIFPDWFNKLLTTINTPQYISLNANRLYELAPYSPPIVITAFKKYLNKSPIEYLTEQKILYACNLLKTTDYTISHISSLCGYDSLSHFNRIFKQTVKCTPNEYRTKK